jgi:hypothetical protein
VGQSTNLGLRIPQHFTDKLKANHRVYADVMNGDKFKIEYIKYIPNMPNLNQLEAAFISLLKTDSFYGYNRSLGRNHRDKEVIKRGNKVAEWS